MRLADIDNSPYFVADREFGEYGVNYDYLYAEHGENAILELDMRGVLAVELDEEDGSYRVSLFSGVSITADADTDLDFEVVVRSRKVLHKV